MCHTEQGNAAEVYELCTCAVVTCSPSVTLLRTALFRINADRFLTKDPKNVAWTRISISFLRILINSCLVNAYAENAPLHVVSLWIVIFRTHCENVGWICLTLNRDR